MNIFGLLSMLAIVSVFSAEANQKTKEQSYYHSQLESKTASAQLSDLDEINQPILNGTNGQDGSDGQDGQDGQDGINGGSGGHGGHGGSSINGNGGNGGNGGNAY